MDVESLIGSYFKFNVLSFGKADIVTPQAGMPVARYDVLKYQLEDRMLIGNNHESSDAGDV